MKKIEKIIKSENFLVFITFFTIYLIVGLLFMHFFNLAKQYNAFFDFDNGRVLGDLAIHSANHYRASVHPLYVILNQPIVSILVKIFNSDILAVALFQSTLGAFSVMVFYIIMKKLKVKTNLKRILTIAFGLSYSQFMFSVMPETYIEASLFLLIAWLYFINLKDDCEYSIKEYTILGILGILSIAVTITNYVQFIVLSAMLILVNNKEKNKIYKFILLNLVVIFITITIAEIQHYIWPSANNYFFTNLNGLINKNSEEFLYMKSSKSLQTIFNVLLPPFVYNLNIFKLYIAGKEIRFDNSMILNLLSLTIAFTFFYNIYNYLKINYLSKKKIMDKEMKLFISMLIVILINLSLHIIYGNDCAFLYVGHYTFAILISIAIILKNNNFIEKNKYIVYLPIILFTIGFNQILYYVVKEYYLIDVNLFGKIPFILIITALILFMIATIYSGKKYLNILMILFILNILIVIMPKKNFFPAEYTKALKAYNQQIIKLKGRNLILFKDKADIKNRPYLFGMASHNKYMYQNGKLINLDNSKIVFQVDKIEDLIIPNMYTVLIRNRNNKLIKIYENEYGLYIETNNTKKEIFRRTYPIKLDNFSGKKYNEILKVLNQEVLFNIRDGRPEANTIANNKVYLRDAMIMTMVLEKSDNTNILKEWIDKENKMYDFTKSNNIKEADNLGELLYILHATKSNNLSLKNKIIEEIEKIKTDEGFIISKIDGKEQKYYPTAIIKNALDKYGIDLGLKLPEEDDGYAQLLWYIPNRVAIAQDLKGEKFPYYTWAAKNYGRDPFVYLLNKTYPLSYKSSVELNDIDKNKVCKYNERLCKKKVIGPHGWTASEIFLYLYNHDIKIN